MPFKGPETVAPPPPLASPPTGLLQSVTVVEHVLLQTEGNLAKLVGPDAPDTVLAAAIAEATIDLLGLTDGETGKRTTAASIYRSEAFAEALDQATYENRELIRDAAATKLAWAASMGQEFVPQGGMELGGDGGPDPFDHWLAGLRWLPEPHLTPELVDPCTDKSVALATLDGGRVVTDATTTNGSAVLFSASAYFTAADIGKAVSGTGIPGGTKILSITDFHTATMTANASASGSNVTVLIQGTATGVSRLAAVTGQAFLAVLHDSCSTFGWEAADYVGRAQRGLAPRETIAVENEFMHGRLMGASRVANGSADGHLTNGSAAITSATADFSQADVGKVITSNIAGIPANTTIATVTDAHTATISANFTGTTSTVALFTIASLSGGTNRYLSDDNCVLYTTGATDPKPIQALAYANEAIARAGIGQGAIHCSAFFVEVASALGYTLQKDARGRLVTLNGNIVIPGNGYDGIGPDGTGGSADDGAFKSGHTHEWIYATDIPVVWRSPDPAVFPASMREATQQSLNEVTYRVQRPYIVQWSAVLQVAIKVNVLG